MSSSIFIFRLGNVTQLLHNTHTLLSPIYIYIYTHRHTHIYIFIVYIDIFVDILETFSRVMFRWSTWKYFCLTCSTRIQINALGLMGWMSMRVYLHQHAYPNVPISVRVYMYLHERRDLMSTHRDIHMYLHIHRYMYMHLHTHQFQAQKYVRCVVRYGYLSTKLKLS